MRDPSVHPWRRWTDAESRTVREMYADGATDAEIGVALGYSHCKEGVHMADDQSWMYVVPPKASFGMFHIRLAGGRTLCGRDAAGWPVRGKSSILAYDDICTVCRERAAARGMEIRL